MVPVNVVGNHFGSGGQQRKVKPRLQFRQKALGGPALIQKQLLHAGAAAIFAQPLLVAEEFRHGARHLDHLFGQHKGVQANRQMRFL